MSGLSKSKTEPKAPKSAAMPLQRIRLELAHDPDFPDGSREHGYDLIAPLDKSGRISVAGWKANRDLCRVRRFWGHASPLVGHIVHKPGRTGGIWAFHYDIREGGGHAHDEPGFHFETHVFEPGEYVSIKEQDGALRTFRVQAVVDFD